VKAQPKNEISSEVDGSEHTITIFPNLKDSKKKKSNVFQKRAVTEVVSF
jgi:hypothetical protein